MSTTNREVYQGEKQRFILAVAEYARQAAQANSKLFRLVDTLTEAGVLSREDIAQLQLPLLDASSNFGAKGGSRVEKKPRRKRVADPNAPKRPLPGYLMYSNTEKKLMKESLAKEGKPQLSMTELNALVAEKWSHLPEETKLKFQKDHEVAIKRYNEEMKEYREKTSAGSIKDEGYESEHYSDFS